MAGRRGGAAGEPAARLDLVQQPERDREQHELPREEAEPASAPVPESNCRTNMKLRGTGGEQEPGCSREPAAGQSRVRASHCRPIPTGRRLRSVRAPTRSRRPRRRAWGETAPGTSGRRTQPRSRHVHRAATPRRSAGGRGTPRPLLRRRGRSACRRRRVGSRLPRSGSRFDPRSRPPRRGSSTRDTEARSHSSDRARSSGR